MAHDEELAARVRPFVHDHAGALGPVEEKRMFGGLAFLVAGRLAVAVGDGDLMLRPDPAELAALLDQEHVELMRMGARTSRTWINVAAPALADDAALEAWVVRGVTGGAP